MKKLFYLALVALIGLAACDTEETDDEIKNWSERNDQYFLESLNNARHEINRAKAEWGEEHWEEHCDYRLLRNFVLAPQASAKQSDTVVVRIIKRGTGSGCPLYSDTVRVNYMGRVIPSKSYPEGFVFDHSGLSDKWEDIFDPTLCMPSRMPVCTMTSNGATIIKGYSTVLQKMHIGDLWSVIIHPDLGYREEVKTQIPAHSVLRFDIELKAFYRSGTVPDTYL